ncbi:MAG: hypothetical protein JSW05_12165 [Candidatus Thorarchaeota archaeon]|nr:MAG: hypothetical protein JSW05_12165 [Candidatus Thorarchaeota archaeon]
MRRAYILATLTILLISGIAYVAGTLQEGFSSTAVQKQDEAREMQTDLERMESRTYYLMERDITRVREYGNLFGEIWPIDMEFEFLNSSLSIEERQVYVRRIVDKISQLQSYQNMLLILHLYRHFNRTTNTYWIASEDNEGYDFSITWELWQAFISDHGSPVTIQTTLQFHGAFFSYPAIQALPYGWRPMDHETGEETFTIESAGIEFLCEYFLLSQIQVLQYQIDQTLQEANAQGAIAEKISLAVSLTTVAMLLATAMASRVSEREVVSEIVTPRKEMGQDVGPVRDYGTVPILIVAIALALLGLYLALY